MPKPKAETQQRSNSSDIEPEVGITLGFRVWGLGFMFGITLVVIPAHAQRKFSHT